MASMYRGQMICTGGKSADLKESMHTSRTGIMLHLPSGVLHSIFRHVNQQRKFEVMLTCQSMNRVIRDPLLWDTLSVYEMNSHAVDFVKDVRPTILKLESTLPEDVIWLLQESAVPSLVATLVHMSIKLGNVHCVAFKFMDALTKYWALESLRIVCQSVRMASTLVFNTETMFPKLRRLVIIDRGMERRNLSVHFEAIAGSGMPLEHVTLIVHCSDLVSQSNASCWVSSLKSLTYWAQHDALDDFALRDFCLDMLNVEIRFDTNTLNLFRQISKSRIEHLEISAYDNVYIGRPLQAEHVFIQLWSPGFLADVDFVSVAAPSRLKSLGFQGGAQNSVTFYNVPNLLEFASFAQTKHLDCSGLNVHLEPPVQQV